MAGLAIVAFAIGLHLQAHGGRVVQHGLPCLDWDSFPDVNHPVRGQSIDGGHDGRVGVLVGVGEPVLFRDADPGGDLRRWRGRLDGRAGHLIVGGTIEAVLSLSHSAPVASAARRGVRPGAAELGGPAFLSHRSYLRGGGGRMVRGRRKAAGVRARQKRRRALGGDTGRLPGRVLRRGLVVVEAGLVRGRLGVAAAGRDAAGGAEAAGIAVAICVGQRQGHDGVDTPFDDLVFGAALLHLVLGILAVGCDLNSRAFQGRGNIGSQAMGQVIAGRCMVVVL